MMNLRSHLNIKMFFSLFLKGVVLLSGTYCLAIFSQYLLIENQQRLQHSMLQYQNPHFCVTTHPQPDIAEYLIV